jgi:putative FmdB family regulatory protein
METDPELPMPIYEYICQKCHHQFEALLYGKEKAQCPKCHATKLEPQLSVFAVSAGSTETLRPVGIAGSRLRIVRRPARPRRLLSRRYELGHSTGRRNS